MSTLLRFDGQVAVVTGAAGGLGRAYALELARRGACVLVNDLAVAPGGTPGSGTPAESTVAAIRAAGGVAVADANDAGTGAEAIVERAMAEWGRVDVVIPNAADVSWPGPGISGEAWRRQFDVNVYGAAALVQAAWPELCRHRGRVVLVSSTTVFGLRTPSAYPTTKAALIGLGRTIARDGAGDGVRVNLVMPAAYSRMSAMIPDPEFVAIMQARFPPEPVAAFVAWLAHRDVPCTGEIFTVGGGRAARVVLGVTPGWRRSDDPLSVTAEEFAAHARDVLDSTHVEVPDGTSAEVRFGGAQLGIDYGDLPFLRQ